MTKYCKSCEQDLDLSFFYQRKNGYYATLCRKCSSLKNNIFDNYNLILNEPNQYKDEIEKKDTFKLMEYLGWTFNTEKEFWYKSGIREKDGTWTNIKEKTYPKNTAKKGEKISEEFRHYVCNLYSEGKSINSITKILNVCKTSVYTILHENNINTTK